jgi:bacillithiol synthase
MQATLPSEINYKSFMLKADSLDFKSSGVLNQLVFDYLEKSERTRPFYDHYPDEKGFKEFLDAKPFQQLDRSALVDALTRQAGKVKNNSELSGKNLRSLGNANVYTITTGHQLCLFTGPLYFIYKIISAVNLAKELSAKFPKSSFVPVFWMASEDHDFEEVNHIHVMGKKLTWHTSQKGAVGSFMTNGLKELLPQLKDLFENTTRGEYLLSLFTRSYLQHDNLSDATRFIVNELFGDTGLVIIDGDDKNLKKQFREILRKDLFENIPFTASQRTVSELKEAGYDIQVNPRQVNCFYLEENLRERIERNKEGFALAGSGRTFSEKQMDDLITGEPNKLSPNVLLRPVYQQTILPNIAYVGGPGELSYWLEYKNMFHSLDCTFPILVPRSFITVVEKNAAKKIEKLKLTPDQFFKSEEDLIRSFQVKNNNVVHLEKERQAITEVYKSLTEKIGEIDKTLEGNVAANLQKAIKALASIEHKANRALRSRSETELSRIRSIRQELFPGGIPQERVENFATFYLKFGDEFLQAVKDNAQPLSFKHRILTEK